MTVATPSATPRAAPSLLVGMAAFVVLVAGMRAAEAMFVPFLLAIFVAIVTAPPVFWLERRGLSRSVALSLVLAGLTGAGVAASAVVGSSLREFSRALPAYKARLAEMTLAAADWLDERGVPIAPGDVLQYIDPGAGIQLAADLFSGFRGVLTNAFLILLTVIFLLLEAHSFPEKLRRILPDPEQPLQRFADFSDKLKRYLAIKTATSLATGAAVTAVLLAVGVDYPLLWGMLAFLLNYVPNIGSVIAAVPALLLALVQLGPGAAGWSALGYVAVNAVVGNVVEPRFLGRGLGLSTLIVFVSLVFWGWVFGPVGMFLSVPLTMTAKIALDSHESTRWLAVLLGPEGDAPRERARPETTHEEEAR